MVIFDATFESFSLHYLPGVATSMLTPFASFLASSCRFVPPMMSPKVWLWYLSSSLRTPNDCMDSSRVGEITITPVPKNNKHGQGICLKIANKVTECDEKDLVNQGDSIQK